ncbi:hypothetical protein [Conexibacter sp. DBS9H8]|uniref:hypothetical protein n=1 Tax=Conexibacter sp. DBS9H8 TaxID=2937801 RepID=UPI00200D6C57|nr:hypothetical protein [Conexibacter sp. DBS9H8]
MQSFAGCALPEEYLYDLELDVWVRPEADGSVRLGMTDVAQTLCGRMVAVTFQKAAGAQVRRGRTLAVIESAKWVGPFRSPLTGAVLEVNAEQFATDPGIVNRDPFGAGWLVRLDPSALEAERGHLLDGIAAFPLVRARIEAEQISCMRCAE